MCTRINYHRKAGRKLNIIIVAEGAIDKQGLSIKTQYIKDVSLID
jgi:6-phosphofructokinase